MNFDLDKFKESKTQISISREGIDNFRIRGFLLGYSKKLILIHYVSDIRLDGLMILPLKDITDIQQDKTDVFQTQMLKDDGIFREIDFQKEYKFSNWRSLLKSIGTPNLIVSVEDETSDFPLHFFGYLRKIKKHSMSLKSFTGAGNWHKGKTVMYYEDITAMQFGSNYINTYARYFQRKT
jgi:hypothetical protein